MSMILSQQSVEFENKISVMQDEIERGQTKMEQMNSELRQANKYTDYFNKMKAKKFRNCGT